MNERMTRLVFSWFLALLAFYGNAQGVSMEVSTSNARQFLKDYPSHAANIVFSKTGGASCMDRLTYEALLSYERKQGLSPSAATSDMAGTISMGSAEPMVDAGAVQMVRPVKHTDAVHKLNKDIKALTVAIANATPSERPALQNKLDALETERANF